MFRSVSRACLVLGFGLAMALGAQQGPPNELVQYVRDAIKAGQNAFQIQQNAVNSGWPLGTVNEAMALVRDQSAGTPPATAAAPPATDDKGSAPAKPAAPAAEGSTPGGTPPAAANATPPAADAKPGDAAKSTPEAGGTKPDSINRGVPDDYQIGAGDVIDINVWHEVDATVHGAHVRTDGKISMPLLKDVEVVGLTPLQLEKKITDALIAGGMIASPDVTIIVTGTESKKIYVQGKVRKEGPIPFIYNMTVMQGLSEAGGITEYAKKKKIFVMRTINGKAYQLPFNYDAVLKGQHLELNIQLQAGDWIIVP